MASSSEFYAKIEMLEKIARDARAKGLKGVKFQVFLKDETDQFNNNVAVRVSPTKEEKEGKIYTDFLGNGRTYWTDGKSTAFDYIARDNMQQPQQAPDPQSNIARYHSAKGVEEVARQANDEEDLPF